ncbi:MAG: hypothetical protein Kow0059_21340 [Candidatus Sumerlaeia bacterium]
MWRNRAAIWENPERMSATGGFNPPPAGEDRDSTIRRIAPNFKKRETEEL